MDIISVINTSIDRAKSAGLVPQKYSFRATRRTTVAELVHFALDFGLSVHSLLTADDRAAKGIETIRFLLDRENVNCTNMTESKVTNSAHSPNFLAMAVIKARMAHQMTQQQLADLTGVSRRTINAVESGQDEVLVTTVAAIADALDVPITYFVRDSNPSIDLAAGFEVWRTICQDSIYADICRILN